MKKSMLRKVLLLACSAVLLVCLSVGATLAYLTSEKTVTNTFTVGKVEIKLDEAPVDPEGNVIANEERRASNSYKLMPGHTYTKDPTVTVVANSEESYVRMIVTVSDIAALKEAFPVDKYPTYYSGDVFLLEKLVGDWDSSVWPCASATAAGVYEFRYNKTVNTLDGKDKTLEALFRSITIPGTVDNDKLNKLQGTSENPFKITIVAQAIQADGFDTAEKAWTAFETK